MALWIYLVLLPAILISCQRSLLLWKNYREARKLGIPIVITPVSWLDPFWGLFAQNLRWVKYLPFTYWYEISKFSAPQRERHLIHRKWGDVFVVVSPKANYIYLNDPKASNDVLSHYKTWTKPEPVYEIFTVLGKNVIADNGEDWQRQRKIINPAFREQNYNLVWDESLKQARQWLDGRCAESRTGSTMLDVRRDMVLIALHVLSGAGFGQIHDFSSGLRDTPQGHLKSFPESLMFLLTNLFKVLLFKNVRLPPLLMPSFIKDLQDTIKDFHLYLKEIVAYHRAITQGGGGGQIADIVSALVEADEAAKREEKTPGLGLGTNSIHLTDEEMFGNLFLFNLAGFETTSNALTYTFPFLALHRDVQDWVGEEIDAVFQDKDLHGLDYADTFPLLVRCLAVMYETLRIWGPLPSTIRWPAGQSQTLSVGGRNIVVPAGMYVITNVYGVHCDPRWWGPDSLEWKPQRWITTDPDTGKEILAQPPPGAVYFPWASGPRICPGKKFSQVEFVAVIAVLLRSYRIKPLIIEGKMKTEKDARAALIEVMEDSRTRVTVNMRHPENAGVDIEDR
ncbi:hypothetical protein PV08_00778 [Exophiala spinifera]|uniref:Cytochrome P450 n=1 Tax=Exophiala spinifera TaxID=91928 RepID=A0A0D2BMN8_9EURO|nr:uncharacterized protein PV08_00778 [Exophiala spinifera]KIW20203.1 hypothetical protein PV08_00778 [Exophiala spinifera]